MAVNSFWKKNFEFVKTLTGDVDLKKGTLQDQITELNNKSTSDIMLDDVSGLSIIASPYTVALTWTDPEDVAIGDITLAKWAGTLVVRKEGSAPISKEDGVVVLNSTIKNRYSEEPFIDTD